MRKTHPFLTLWESHRFKSDGNRFSAADLKFLQSGRKLA